MSRVRYSLFVAKSTHPEMTRSQFNKTFTRVIYKYSYCSQTRWLHLLITRVKCGRGKIKMPIKLY